MDEALERAEKAKNRQISIYAWDNDPKAVAIARKNAELAQVDHLIDFRIQDFLTLTKDDVPSDHGYIITDPPYG